MISKCKKFDRIRWSPEVLWKHFEKYKLFFHMQFEN